MNFFWDYEADEPNVGRIIVAALLTLILLVAGAMTGCPRYSIWSQEMRGKADLAEAEWNRQIKVTEASAAKEAAILLKDAEVTRARGAKESMELIQGTLTEEYIRYLWVLSLSDSQGETIYVPTEANLPILEAGRKRGAE